MIYPITSINHTQFVSQFKEDTMNRGGKFSVLSSNISTLEAEECASEMSSLAQ